MEVPQASTRNRYDANLSPVREYRELEYGEQFVVFADPAETQDFCAAVALSKKHYDYPLVYNQITESSQFGYELYNFCQHIQIKTGMWPVLAVESNVGQATLFVLQQMNYPRLFRMPDVTGSNYTKQGNIGWRTTGTLTGGEVIGTRRKMLDDFALTLRQSQVTMYDEQQILQFKAFVVVKGKAQARANMHDDLVMATTGAWQIHLMTPTEYLDDFDITEFRKQQEVWRFK
jgi:hypothetical protein